MYHLVKLAQGDQTLRHVPMDEFGRPQRIATATYTIVDMRESEGSSARTVQASAAAVLGSASTTLDEAAGPTASHGDQNRIPVAAVTNFVAGRTYLLERADGSARETVICSGVDASNGRLYSLHPVQHDYASSDLIRACELEATFPSAEAASEESVQDGGGPYQVLWSYEMTGKDWLVPEPVWLVRYDFAPLCTDAEVVGLYPPLADRGKGRFTVRMALAAAHDDLYAELLSAGIDPTLYRFDHSLRQAVRYKAVEHMLRWCQTEADAARADLCMQRYDRLVGNVLQGKPGQNVHQVNRADDVVEPSAQVDAWLVPG